MTLADVLSSLTHNALEHRSETASLTPTDRVARSLRQLISFVPYAKTESAVLLLSDASCSAFRQHPVKAAVTLSDVVPQCADIGCTSSPGRRKKNIGDQGE